MVCLVAILMMTHSLCIYGFALESVAFLSFMYSYLGWLRHSYFWWSHIHVPSNTLDHSAPQSTSTLVVQLTSWVPIGCDIIASLESYSSPISLFFFFDLPFVAWLWVGSTMTGAAIAKAQAFFLCWASTKASSKCLIMAFTKPVVSWFGTLPFVRLLPPGT